MTTALAALPERSPVASPPTSSPGAGGRRLLARCFSFPACVACIFAVMVYLMIPQSVADPDIWWHLRNAEWQLHAHAFLTRDMFSFTALGAPWIDHEWLAELPFYAGWRLLGARGLFWVTVAAIETIFLGVFSLAYRKSASPLAALAVSAVAALLSTISFGPRTLLFGWICMVLELLILDSFRSRNSTPSGVVFLLPLLFAVWVNTHGSWLIGAVVFVVFIIAGMIRVDAGAIKNLPWLPGQRRALFASAGLSAAALFLNPYGYRLVAYPFDMAFRQKLNIANVEEWRSLDFHSPRGRILFAVLALLFLAQLLRQRFWTPGDLGFVAIGVYSAAAHSRFLFLAGILVMPLLVQSSLPMLSLPVPRRPPAANKPWANAALLLLLLPLVARHLPDRASLERSGEDRFPLRASAYLKSMDPHGNVFNDFLWGGYLIWNAPQLPVLIDSRVDIFEYNGVFQDYLDAIRIRNTLGILDKYRIRYVVFPVDSPLVYLLQHTTGWKIDYADSTTVVLEHNRTQP